MRPYDLMITDQVMPESGAGTRPQHAQTSAKAFALITVRHSEHAAGEAAKCEEVAWWLTQTVSRAVLLSTVRDILPDSIT